MTLTKCHTCQKPFSEALDFIGDFNVVLDEPAVIAVLNWGPERSLYIVPGIFGVIFWVLPSMLAAIAMVREQESGTIVQVYASDLSAVEWLLGKELAYLLIGLSEAVLAISIAAVLFGLRLRDDPSLSLVGTVIFLAAAVAFGLFVGVRAGNQTGAVQGTAIARFLTALLLSGFIYGTGWEGVWYAPLAIALLGGLLFRIATRSLGTMYFPN